ncbi:PepSY domain-containing protein [Flavobacteriaceae bacterium S0825]|uniref:PepSY-associated TM helix domain-containing protein n=1 Tax=Gaetbulibacter sp. S0825 TaxID=2720084 RepID=UPI001430B2B2|nr:PepSY-associated TM helix domain-containing protein [Gaetbulibacter sp. S0825]MCK0109279.1 PepSY domain-containing protein [Flavobacteriaceae bacterium S0825]NIX64913.1 PepSY domain-containing protein [Gaetbulibacter sp. S0825]
MNKKTRVLAKETRWYRRLHKTVAIPLVVFLFLVGVTGLLLTWKDELKLKPPSQEITQQQNLIGLKSIEDIAINYSDSLNLDNTINRIDYRPSKGIAKVRFEYHFTELQINCYTGDIVSVKQRTADLIEMIHDGSIIDYLFKSDSHYTKLLYSTLTSLGLIILSISGFMMWLRPKQIKALKQQKL